MIWRLERRITKNLGNQKGIGGTSGGFEIDSQCICQQWHGLAEQVQLKGFFQTVLWAWLIICLVVGCQLPFQMAFPMAVQLRFALIHAV